MKIKSIFLATAVACYLLSCTKSKDVATVDNNDVPLTISSISPAHGAGGTNITIYGTGFSTTSTNDTVKINGKITTIVSAKNDSLIVTIPIKAGTGSISLTVGGKTVIGPELKYDTVYAVTTYAGSTAGATDGAALNAQFKKPTGICSDAAGNLYISDCGNYKIRKISSTGIVSTLAGSTQGFVDGSAATAQFKQPMGICRDGQGTLYIVDQTAHAIRQFTASGGVTTITGGTDGYAAGTVAATKFSYPAGICLNATGVIYVTDAGNSLLRSITGGWVYNVAGSPCQTGSSDGTGSQAQFNDPMGVCTDGQGNFYLADTYGQKIRKVAPGSVVTTIAGSDAQGHTDGTGAAAKFFQPSAICIDASGTLYVADTYNHLIRKITPAGVVTTIAGSGSSGNADGIGVTASFNTPFGICIDAQGVLYVADSYNNTIRKIVQQ